ncbi:MAG: hypothetical protein ACI9U2_004294 [Bradymonadia bacterium]
MIRALLALCVCAPWMLASTAAAQQARFALVIGANAGEPGEVQLRFAEDDASDVADVFTRLAGVPEENMTLLRGRDAPRVRSVLSHLGTRIAAAKASGAETVLFVYYSGHADAGALHLGSSRLELSALKAGVNATGAQVAVLIVDACRSGALTRVKGGAPARPFVIQGEDRLASEGTAIITSSAAGEDAQESDKLEGGIFTHHLVTGLRGAADSARDGKVSLSEAYDYAYRETLRSSSRARFVQHPTYRFQLSGRQDLVVTTLESSAGLARLQIDAPGGWILLPQGAGDVVELSVDTPVELLVQPDRYRVRRRTSEVIYEGSVDARAGAVTAISADELTPVPYGLTVRKGLSNSPAWGPLVAAEVTGPLRPDLSRGIRSAAGVRIDLRQLAIEARFAWTIADATNSSLQIDQDAWGIDLTGAHVFDIGPIGLSTGLRVGADLVRQRFETAGDADPRLSLVGRAGPQLRLEYAPTADLTVSLGVGVDALARRDATGGLALSAQPSTGLGVIWYVP